MKPLSNPLNNTPASVASVAPANARNTLPALGARGIWRHLSRLMFAAMVWSFATVSSGAGLPGAIYFAPSGSGNIERFDLSSGGVSSVTRNDSGWDIGWNGAQGVKFINPSAFKSNQGVRYIIFNTSSGTTAREIIYHPRNGDKGGFPALSPNGQLLALRATLDDGLVIMDMRGRVITTISGQVKYLQPIAWEAGGTLLFKKDRWLMRLSADFRRLERVREIPHEWNGHVATSPDGRKIALAAGPHIWMMNADGSNFHAVTQSSQQEGWPEFSPDSRWLALQCNPRAASAANSELEVYVTGTAPHLCIIPADGQVYTMEPGKDRRVIHPQPRGKKDSRGVGMLLRAGFVWRPR
jgi:hypothetical protein